MWYLIVNRKSGELVSMGTVLAEDIHTREDQKGRKEPLYDVIEYGKERPDLEKLVWDSERREFVERPAPVLIDRLEELETMLQGDQDWVAIKSELPSSRQKNLDDSWKRQLIELLGDRRFRRDDEPFAL